jgi:cell division protein FtsI/penicillin-binding protein 2
VKGVFLPDRTRYLLAGVALLVLTVLLRLIQLQVFQGAHYAEVARKQAQEIIEVDLPRANLVDRNGFVLAASTLCPSLYTFDPQKIADKEGLARAVALLSEREASAVLRDLQTRRKFTWLARKIPFEKYPEARALCERFPGVRIMDEAGRYYPNGRTAANLLGCMGTDAGLAGLEHHWNKELEGGVRHYLVFRDAKPTRLIPVEVAPQVDPPPRSVRLTIDLPLQSVCEEVLSSTVEELHALDGVALVLDPKDGSILAMAVCPTFDPNRPADSPRSAWRNRAVTDSYEPGSTFKLVTLASALDTGRLSLHDPVAVGNGTLTVGPKTIHDDEPPVKSVYTVEEVLQHSSNVGAARIGMSVGPDVFYAYMRRFGFGEVTALHLAGEVAGRLRPPKEWSALSLPSLSFGQELRVTPLQLALAYASVASGGLKVVPRLWADAPVPPFERILKASTAADLTRALCRVVEDGTGKKAALPGVAVAGKTGTAQKLGMKSADGRKLFIAYFVGFAPAENPKAVVLVMVDEPVGRIYGGSVSAPAFARILAFALKRLSYPEALPPTELAFAGGRP